MDKTMSAAFIAILFLMISGFITVIINNSINANITIECMKNHFISECKELNDK